ncbi:MAG TPA: nitrous oxide reductase accessory protein NosL [Planctomycetota bacterium]|nr:nitrous oxide reductase accessory protein NosL [Planctomycetota bacterium]
MKGHEALLVLLLALGCGGALRPVEIALNEEECSLCRMAISRRSFAAEAVTTSGAADFFDDIGCLVRWAAERPPPEGTALFVVDFRDGSWLDATRAHFVRAASLETPMGSGLAAFGSAETAGEEARRLGGQVLDWGGLRGQEPE